MIPKVISLFEIALSKPQYNNNESFQPANCRFLKTLVVIKKSSNTNKIDPTTNKPCTKWFIQKVRAKPLLRATLVRVRCPKTVGD